MRSFTRQIFVAVTVTASSITIIVTFQQLACLRRVPYEGIFGGVTAFKAEHFERVNGFSNQFYGWGGEDDDMYNRQVYHNCIC